MVRGRSHRKRRSDWRSGRRAGHETDARLADLGRWIETRRNDEVSDLAAPAMVDAQTWRCTALSGHPSLPLSQYVRTGCHLESDADGEAGRITDGARVERTSWWIEGGEGDGGRERAGWAWAEMVERAWGTQGAGSGSGHGLHCGHDDRTTTRRTANARRMPVGMLLGTPWR